MPLSQSYNTRLRTHSQIHPPRRLCASPSPPPRLRASRSKPVHASPPFPPANTQLHPDDAANKTFLAIGRALLAVDNRAITIKDLSVLTLDHGLLCQSPSAASQAITTFIRNHLTRCRQDRSVPLLLSLPLTGTPEDDRLAPALHSRSGGTSAPKHLVNALTSFRRGTTVWYLSEAAGAPCPFRRAGLSTQLFTAPPLSGTKRKRESLHAPGPAMATRNRTHPPRVRVKLTLTVRDPPPAPDPDESELSELESIDVRLRDSRLSSSLSPPPDRPPSPAESSSQLALSPPPSPPLSQHLPPYPILSPSIPSPLTPLTSLASPSDPCQPYNSPSALCSTQFINSFRTALSNPPRDLRARSSSLPFSAASPPPDSEDEDDDYHNSMVGLRRGSLPLPLKKEESLQDLHPVSQFPPLLQIPDPAPLLSPWDHPDSAPLKREHPDHGLSTPLELLPGFGSLAHSSHSPGRPPVKHEPISAVLPPANLCSATKPSHPNPTDFADSSAVGKGTREDPVRIDPVVADIELLGPESVRSRDWDGDWDAAWALATEVNRHPEHPMDVDRPTARPPFHPEPPSPAETTATAPTSISSPPAEDPVSIAFDHDVPFLVHPLRSCDPPVVATVIEGVPVYRTLLAPGLPLLRRIDTSFVNLTPLILLLDLPLSALLSHTHPTPRMSISCAPEPLGGTWVPLAVAQSVAAHNLPVGVLDLFLSDDLGLWFPDALARLVQLRLEVGIRVEDVFEGVDAECQEHKQDARLEVHLRVPPLLFEPPRASLALTLPAPLNEQEESIFHSLVDLFATPPTSAPPSPPLKPVPAPAPALTTSSAQKENTTPAEDPPPPPTTTTKSDGPPPVRRKREKPALVEVPVPPLAVRRSKRALGAKVATPVTRSRTRGSY